MRWLIAPTALKGSLSAKEAASVIAKAILDCSPNAETILCPVADGGTNTLECLIDATHGRYYSQTVTGSLNNKKSNARWGALGDQQTAVIEIAEAVGLHLLKPSEYDAANATTYGVGELIKTALDTGYRKLHIALGGSATVDGGAGALQALGLRLLDQQGRELPRGGIQLLQLDRIDDTNLDARLHASKILLLSDVTAVLCGEQGAAEVFGKQKGATAAQIHVLDSALNHFSKKLKEQFHRSVADIPGSGAAGGLAAGLTAVCNAPICLGIEIVMDLLDFDSKLANCDAVIVAEGQLDLQTLSGKALWGVAKRAQKFHKPVHAFVGRIVGDPVNLQKQLGLASIHQISPTSLTVQEAMYNAKTLLHNAVIHYCSQPNNKTS